MQGFKTGCTDPDNHRRALKSSPLFMSFNFVVEQTLSLHKSLTVETLDRETAEISDLRMTAKNSKIAVLANDCLVIMRKCRSS